LLYTLAAYLLAPLYCGALLWRGLREPGYRRGFGQRLGFGLRLAQPTVWLHGASVGEIQAAAIVAGLFEREAPGTRLVVTATTAAGLARAQALFADRDIDVRYLPLDLPGATRRFLAHTRPRLALILETEIWPNLFLACHRAGVPLVLASARISERSARRYGRLGVFRRALAPVALAAAQTAQDAARLRSLGVPAGRLRVTGNVKADFTVPAGVSTRGASLRARYAPARPLWVAGSTHEGEEAQVLAAHAAVELRHPAALLVLAPRHPPRFQAVAAWLAREGVPFVRHSQLASLDDATLGAARVVLVDGLGELLDFYAAGDVAFVGGSLVAIGGHNLLEPAALARPVLTGPSYANAPDIARTLISAGAARVVADGAALGSTVTALLGDAGERARMGAAALAAVDANRGAAARLWSLLAPLAGGEPVQSPP